MILILKEKLLRNQVDSKTAKEICGELAFDLAILQDQGEIKLGKVQYQPVICFVENNTELHFNSRSKFQLHDHAYGNNSEIYETN